MVLAGPGSGKTSVIVERTAYMTTEGGISPSNILVVTFSRAAAKEMKERFLNFTGQEYTPITFGTFHGVFYGILKQAYGFTAANILSEEEKSAILRELALNHGGELAEEGDFSEEVAKEISVVKGNRISLEYYYSSCCPDEVFRQIYREYVKTCQARRKLDFDDMILYCYELFDKRKDILAAWQNKFQYILVDEFQDINQLQYDIVKLLAKPQDNLFIVGDDDQSIYHFRGARPEIMLNFPKDFPQAHVFCISTNYRSYPAIIGCAGKLIGFNKNRYEKQFLSGQTGDAKIRVIGEESPAHQMKDVSGDVKSCGYAFNESAVLYRNNRQAEQVAEKFSEEGIPYYCTEAIPDSYEHWIWYDILAYYRLSRGIAAPGDFKRIADRPNRYMRLILHEAGGEQEADLLEAASRKYTDWRRDNARKIIRKYFYDIREMGKKSPRQFLDYLLKDVGYEKYLREYAESLQQDFDEMKHMLSIYQRDSQKFHTMKEWLLYIKKRSMNLNNNNDQGVCLSTMHRSKGLEWKNVYIIDCNEGYIPPGSPDTPISQEEVEEERRLFYVAVTRAKERLFITYVGNKKGKPVSRFVRELQLKESGRAKTVKKNDMVRHKTYGVCMVLSVNGSKCTIRSLSDDRDAEVLVSSLDIR